MSTGMLMQRIRCQSSTDLSHYLAVERVIKHLRDHLHEPLSLQEMARVAMFSPFHFNRVFHQMTGLPPGQFLSMLRMQAAKRLLLTSRSSVTDICYDVGYDSLGTFIRRFTQFVGVSPSRLRRLPEAAPLPNFYMLEEQCAKARHSKPGTHRVHGLITGRTSGEGPIFVGLFPTPIPTGRPVGCTILTSPGAFKIYDVPEGRYYMFAAAFPWSQDPMSYLLPDESRMSVGMVEGLVSVGAQTARARARLELRPVRTTDPPIVVALPLLLLKHQPATQQQPTSEPHTPNGQPHSSPARSTTDKSPGSRPLPQHLPRQQMLPGKDSQYS